VQASPATPLASGHLASFWWLTPLPMGAMGPCPTSPLGLSSTAPIAAVAEPPAPITDPVPATRQAGPKPPQGKPGPLAGVGHFQQLSNTPKIGIMPPKWEHASQKERFLVVQYTCQIFVLRKIKQSWNI